MICLFCVACSLCMCVCVFVACVRTDTTPSTLGCQHTHLPVVYLSSLCSWRVLQDEFDDQIEQEETVGAVGVGIENETPPDGNDDDGGGAVPTPASSASTIKAARSTARQSGRVSAAAAKKATPKSALKSSLKSAKKVMIRAFLHNIHPFATSLAAPLNFLYLTFSLGLFIVHSPLTPCTVKCARGTKSS